MPKRLVFKAEDRLRRESNDAIRKKEREVFKNNEKS